MKYLSITEATDWPEKYPWYVRLLGFIFPDSNLGYEPMHLVKKWLIEFKEGEGEFHPWREIALGVDGKPIFAGPDEKNYGFWNDTNMKYKDFKGNPIEKDEFEVYWKMSGVKAIEFDNEE